MSELCFRSEQVLCVSDAGRGKVSGPKAPSTVVQ